MTLLIAGLHADAAACENDRLPLGLNRGNHQFHRFAPMVRVGINQSRFPQNVEIVTGPVILHASAALPSRESFEDDCDFVEEATGLTLPVEISLGAVIGVFEILKIVRDSKSPWAAVGQCHWCTKPVIEFSEPIVARGALRLFWINDFSMLAEIAEQIREQGL